MQDLKEMPKLAENQKSYGGIPEAVFVVSDIKNSNLKFFGA